ncbi:MAG: hypothetical protein J6D18_03805 [Erysipelotrichaceae bacterium]|nr:hypothetical protein [Erysipelotrichaceae bacterium]
MTVHLYTAAGKDLFQDIKKAKQLGCVGILTNVELLLEMFGSGHTPTEMTRKLLEMDKEMKVFMSVYGESAKEMIQMAHDCCRLSKRVGVKIPSCEEGFLAIRQLSKEGIDCIATTLFTYSQAYMALATGAYAISPFMHRGQNEGLDMNETLRQIRALYDRYENAPEILAASIRTGQEAQEAILNGADAIAAHYGVLAEMMNSSPSRKVIRSWDKPIDLLNADQKIKQHYIAKDE